MKISAYIMVYNNMCANVHYVTKAWGTFCVCRSLFLHIENRASLATCILDFRLDCFFVFFAESIAWHQHMVGLKRGGVV